VGWFTTIFPIRLELSPRADELEALRSIKDQLRRVPNRGFGYGVLRYLSPADEFRNDMAAQPEPEVAFNYLGQLGESSSPIDASESNISPRAHRPNLLEIDAMVTGGRLQIVWSYSENVHRRETIEKLAATGVESLRALIATTRAPRDGALSPSEFAKSGLDRRDLQKLLTKLR
jgi:non-ribosomal peptide synthase protein (TIGR01720 family)